ncbi:ATP-dependent DNA helicase RecG [Aliikangiella sp. IMCC44359]|uniref:ATP-dependent DNA helicase RecG n=1 Tax=Aliikangiella sp. IMCC44359 TaxID=3459125 RepID=UPI00403B1EC6
MQTKLATINVSTLKGVGPKVAERLAHLSIRNLEDLLFHLPYKYQDRSRIHPISSLRQGEYAQVCGMIETANIVFGKRRSLVCKISDDTGTMEIRLFYFSTAQKKQFITGQFVQCYGQISHSGRSYSMIHPEIKYLHDNPTPQLEEGLKAIYPTTEGLQQKTINAIIQQGLGYLKRAKVTELLPESWLTKLGFPPLAEALLMLHQPPLDVPLTAIENGENLMIKRLAFEELVAQHIALQKAKKQIQRYQAYEVKKINPQLTKFLDTLPFNLTTAQQRVIQEVRVDIQRNYPMMRLVQGDVGSGKTLVAAVNMFDVSGMGFQSALMAPTEILAEQHYKSFVSWFKPFAIEVTLLTSKMPAADKRKALETISTGQSQMVIGTHALFQSQVSFHHLALVVIDEQHRFGVEQRKTLLEKGVSSNQNQIKPHQLIMTATPIPRTLAQTAYADLDLSVIDELPPGRKPITTVVMDEAKRELIIQRVKQNCIQDNRQVYWVCTLIDESEELQCQAAEVTHEQLQAALPELKVGLIHGRMKPQEKQQIMQAFKEQKMHLLVATTVIEVGVDVPNASLMIIENPERLGLSQLHQLRGRVGRGEKESHCVLLYHAPLSKNAKQRLNVMRETNDGFVIAEKDLELRGPGEVLGTRQTGILEYKFADIIRDSEMLPDVYFCADEIMQQSPKIAEALCSRWIKHGDKLSRV